MYTIINKYTGQEKRTHEMFRCSNIFPDLVLEENERVVFVPNELIEQLNDAYECIIAVDEEGTATEVTITKTIEQWRQENLTLSDAQAAKISEIAAAYQAELTAGFSSLATGAPQQFAYAQKDQDKFLKLALMVAKNKIPFPYPIPNKDGLPVPHTAVQYEELETDIMNFEQALQTKLVLLTAPAPVGSIMNAETVKDVQAIVW